MNKELEPCPFCGKQPKFIPATCDDIGNGYECKTLAVIQCDTCLYEMAHETDEQAIMAWNTRYKRTCKYKQPDPVNTPGVWNTECGHHVYWNVDNKDCGTPPKHCPECGAEVVNG